MRVDYTLPGTQLRAGEGPATQGPGGAQGAGRAGVAAGFPAKLKKLSAGQQITWKQLLGLDRPSGAMTALAAPPRPPSVEIRDAASERLRWRNTLDRHSRLFTDRPPGFEPPPALRDIERMLALLIQMQDAEDVVVSRHLAESRS
jgi:hypothetical protein